jgi:hypothetical protein
MEYRNSRFISNSLIDCEINHPLYGWILFTADPTDKGAQFDVATMFAEMAADPNTIPWDGTPLPRYVPGVITRRQCAKQLLTLGMITGQEAIDMTQMGKPPASVQAYLDQLPEPDRTMATIDFAADTYYRDNPLLTALMSANGMTEEQVDDYFIAAADL